MAPPAGEPSPFRNCHTSTHQVAEPYGKQPGKHPIVCSTQATRRHGQTDGQGNFLNEFVLHGGKSTVLVGTKYSWEKQITIDLRFAGAECVIFFPFLNITRLGRPAAVRWGSLREAWAVGGTDAYIIKRCLHYNMVCLRMEKHRVLLLAVILYSKLCAVGWEASGHVGVPFTSLL